MTFSVPAGGGRKVAVLFGRSPDERYSLHRGYVDAVARVGAVPVLVPAGPGLPDDRLLELVQSCDALFVTGGGDVCPSLYGAPDEGGLMSTDASRDAMEVAAVQSFVALGRPVLGICRGAQLLAVTAGGRLVADLPSAGHDGHWAEEREHEPVHGIEPEEASMALAALGGATEVNSIHHQAVADPGYLRASAWSPDGVVEAVEGPGMLGLQWHPERLVRTDRRHLAPFRWLVTA